MHVKIAKLVWCAPVVPKLQRLKMAATIIIWSGPSLHHLESPKKPSRLVFEQNNFAAS